MPDNYAAESFHTKKLVADFLQVKCNCRGKTADLHFEPPLGDLGAMYDDHLRLIGKLVGGLPISVN